LKNYFSCQKISIVNLCVFFSFLILAFACKKEEEIGAGIQPASDKLLINQADSFSIKTSLVKAQPIITSNSLLNVAGDITDPVFGKSTAAFYTQFSLPTSNVSFHDLEGNNPVLDSLVFILKYTDCHGNSASPLTFHIYELTEDLPEESIYSNAKFKYSSEDTIDLNSGAYWSKQGKGGLLVPFNIETISQVNQTGFICGTSTISDYDSNVYNTVQIYFDLFLL